MQELRELIKLSPKCTLNIKSAEIRICLFPESFQKDKRKYLICTTSKNEIYRIFFECVLVLTTPMEK